jgi:hypothetical protein
MSWQQNEIVLNGYVVKCEQQAERLAGCNQGLAWARGQVTLMLECNS